MKTLIITSEINSTINNAEAIKAQAIAQLESRGFFTANDVEEVINSFDGEDPATELVQSFYVQGEEEEGTNYQPTFEVKVFANYIDGGSDDYIYTIEVREL